MHLKLQAYLQIHSKFKRTRHLEPGDSFQTWEQNEDKIIYIYIYINKDICIKYLNVY